MYEHYDLANQLKRCLPLWLGEFKEIGALQTAQTRLLENIKAAVNRLIDNQSICTADDETLSALEQFLNIEQKHDRGTTERVRLIRSHFVGNGRFGINEILDIVAVFTASPCTVSYKNGKIDVKIARNIQDTFISGDCLMMLEKRKPAHLLLNLTTVNPFTLNAYAGGFVSEYKQEEVDG